MAREIRQVISRSADTLMTDALGLAALVVVLIGGLCLPSLL